MHPIWHLPLEELDGQSADVLVLLGVLVERKQSGSLMRKEGTFLPLLPPHTPPLPQEKWKPERKAGAFQDLLHGVI